MNRIVLIAGPTCSGKSAVALNLADKLNGVLINADSMQVYREIPLLSAQPSASDRATLPHMLYGHVSASERYSVGAWLEDVGRALKTANADGRVPIIVGGTGLYFQALTNGLSDIPPIPEFVRSYRSLLAKRHGLAALRARLTTLEPEEAAAVGQMDRQRLMRALDVRLATGHSLGYWQSMGTSPVVSEGGYHAFVLNPPREVIYERCEQRFDEMIRDGAVEEVAKLLELGLPPSAPAMKALGVPQLSAYLRGQLSVEEAVSKAKTATRRYAKRQYTWINGHMIAWNKIYEQDSEQNSSKIFSIIKENGLTM